MRHAVRAVDTATDPEFQGRGIFTRLTLEALDELAADGVDFVFNTPNARSRPGYLKMGWQVVGRLAAAVRPTRWRFVTVVGTARRPAGRGFVASSVGVPAGEALADRGIVDRLLADVVAAAGLATRRSRNTSSGGTATRRSGTACCSRDPRRPGRPSWCSAFDGGERPSKAS